MPTPFEEDFFNFEPPTDFRTFDAETGMRVLYVHAYFAEDLELDCVYPDDWLAPGIYQVLVPSDLPDGAAAMCALTTFQHVIPVKHINAIELTVREPNGKEVLPDFDIEDPKALVEVSGPVTRLLPAKHLACRPGWMWTTLQVLAPEAPERSPTGSSHLAWTQ